MNNFDPVEFAEWVKEQIETLEKAQEEKYGINIANEGLIAAYHHVLAKLFSLGITPKK